MENKKIEREIISVVSITKVVHHWKCPSSCYPADIWVTHCKWGL